MTFAFALVVERVIVTGEVFKRAFDSDCVCANRNRVPQRRSCYGEARSRWNGERGKGVMT